MNALRSALFVLLFYPVSVGAVLFAIPAAMIGRRTLFGTVHFWVWWHCWCTGRLLRIRTRIEGRIPEGPVLVAGKHEAMYETIEVVRLLRDPAVVLKRELADLPGWGKAAQRYGMIPVDREGGAPALRRMLAAAQAVLAEGRPIVIFPEGTRVELGEQPPLQPGFAGLYKALGVPVVPFAVDSGRVWPRRSWVKRPGFVTFRFADPIPPGLPRKEVEARVHSAINALEGAR